MENEVKIDLPVLKNNSVNEISKLASDTSTELPSRKRDPLDYHEENSSIPILGLDEAQAVLESVWKTDDGVITTTRKLKTAARGFSFGGNKTTTKFHYAAVNKTGHSISTKKPELCEVVGKGDFQKVISLIAIFEERQIKRGEHILLYFDTATNAMPEIFVFVFKYHFKIQEKITNNYEAFKSRENSILVCSYPTFRGLEHPKITVVIIAIFTTCSIT